MVVVLFFFSLPFSSLSSIFFSTLPWLQCISHGFNVAFNIGFSIFPLFKFILMKKKKCFISIVWYKVFICAGFAIQMEFLLCGFSFFCVCCFFGFLALILIEIKKFYFLPSFLLFIFFYFQCYCGLVIYTYTYSGLLFLSLSV